MAWTKSRCFAAVVGVLAIMGVSALVGCGGGDRQDSQASRVTNRVFVANGAIEYFARRIGGSDIDVWFPVPDKVDPSHWRPGDSELREIQRCRLILLDHPGYSPWVVTVSLPGSRVVDTTRPFAGRLIRLKQTVTHRHGPGGTHSHSGFASCPWLDPDLAELQAEAVLLALEEAFPERSQGFRQRWGALQSEIEQWRGELAELREQTRGTPLLASHPVYEYLGRWGEWRLSSLHLEPSSGLDDEAWDELSKLQRQTGATVMLWEAEPLAETRRKLEQLGVSIVVFHPLFAVADGRDWLAEMRGNVKRLGSGLRPE